MANRVVFGLRSGEYGVWVSKPGFNVLTTGVENLLYAFEDEFGSVVMSGIQTIPQAANISTPGIANVSVPNQGFIPRTLVIGDDPLTRSWVSWSYPNNSTLRLKSIDTNGTRSVRFLVFNQQLV